MTELTNQTNPADNPALPVDKGITDPNLNQGGVNPSDIAIKNANAEAARYRTERNSALKELHAVKTVLSEHGIQPGALDMSGLTINNGKVLGTVPYKPQMNVGFNTPISSIDNGVGGNVMNKESIALMNPEQINQNWETIRKILSA